MMASASLAPLVDTQTSSSARLTACPVCAGAVSLWRNKATSIGRFAIDRCTGCGFAFANPRPSASFLAKFYSESGHTTDGSSRDDTVESVLEEERVFPNSTLDAVRIVRGIHALLDVGGTEAPPLLDVGCGYGFYMREARHQGFDVTGIELASTERRIATQLTGVMPADVTFEAFAGRNDGYAALLMSQILEHALDVNAWLDKSRELLRPQGVLAIAVPNFGSVFRRVLQERDPFVTPPAHLNYFDHKNLGRLLDRHGFRVKRFEWASRISPRSLQRRFAGAAPVVGTCAGLTLGALDRAGLGMMVTAYAVRSP